MTEENKTPPGFGTLAVRFTRSFIDRVILTARKARQLGWTEEKIQEKMGKDLVAYPPHAVRRIYQMTLGQPIPDDIPVSDVVVRKEPKADTLELTAKAPVPGIDAGGLLQHGGYTWYVVSVRANTYLIKKLS